MGRGATLLCEARGFFKVSQWSIRVVKVGRGMALLCEARGFVKVSLWSIRAVKAGEGHGTSLRGQGVH